MMTTLTAFCIKKGMHCLEFINCSKYYFKILNSGMRFLKYFIHGRTQNISSFSCKRAMREVIRKNTFYYRSISLWEKTRLGKDISYLLLWWMMEFYLSIYYQSFSIIWNILEKNTQKQASVTVFRSTRQ